MDDGGLYAALVQRGMSRRSFLQFSAAMAAALALPASFAPRIAAAVEVAPRLPVIWLRAQTCGGNTEATLRSIDPTVTELFLDTVSVDYHDSLLAVAGASAGQTLADAIKRYPNGYVLVVEGSIPKAGFCIVNGRNVEDVVREAASGALAVIAAGSCAVDGGITSAHNNQTDGKGIKDLVGSAAYISLPGCPMNVVNLVSVLVHYLTFREWPPADIMSRPLSAYGNLIHNECERRPHFEFGEFALAWGDEGAQRGWCLYKLGCKGPETMGNCPEVRYGGGVSWNVRAGEGCIGCMSPSFWNQMGPAYKRLPAVVPVLPGLTADAVGAVLIGGMTGVIVAHGTGMTIRFKRRSRIARKEAAAAAAAGQAGTADAPGVEAAEASTGAAVAVADDQRSAVDAPSDSSAQTGEREA